MYCMHSMLQIFTNHEDYKILPFNVTRNLFFAPCCISSSNYESSQTKNFGIIDFELKKFILKF